MAAVIIMKRLQIAKISIYKLRLCYILNNQKMTGESRNCGESFYYKPGHFIDFLGGV